MLTAEQVALRNEKIGGSDAAVCLGLSPFMTARELHHVFTGEMDRPDFDPINAFIGHQMEPMIANWWTEETGLKIRNSNITTHSKTHAFAVAHPDRLVVGKREGIELKTAATPEGWGYDGESTVPEHYFLQAAHYMEVFDYERWHVAVFFLVSREFRKYTIERDKDFGARLMDLEALFMEGVAKKEPPGWDYNHPTTLELMKVIYPNTNGQACDLNQTMLDWWNVREDAQLQVRQYKAAADAAKARILGAMGQHALGYLPDGATLSQKHDANGAVRLTRRRAVNYQ